MSITLSQANLTQCEGKASIPNYDRSNLIPAIVHIGVGGFHRAHQAVYLDNLARKTGTTNWGICGVGLLKSDEAMKKALTTQDCLFTLVERSAKGDQASIVGSICKYLWAEDSREAVIEQLANPTTRIVTLTITEGGYCFNQATGEFDASIPTIKQDLQTPATPTTAFGIITEALARRHARGTKPFTILSCGNIVKNGDVAKKMFLSFAKLRDGKLASWIEQEVTFPNCMVDRITPVTTDEHRALVLNSFDIKDAWPVVTEPYLQWVVEDKFCNGRPEWEKVGVQMTPDVHPYEMMKIRLLNAGHSALGYLGYLAGFRYIYEICTDKEFRTYLCAMMDKEVTPLLKPVPGVNLDAYKDSLLERFSNPTIKDQATRICMDGSNKLPKFVLPSITESLAKGGSIDRLTLCIASWFRFLQGTDEQGKEIPLDDPMGARLRELAKAGGKNPEKLLGLTEIFGDLSQNKVFTTKLRTTLESLYDKGARETLRQYLN